MPGTRSNITSRINNLDLGDHTSHYRFRDLMLQLIELGGIGFGGDKFYVDPVNGDDSNDGTGPDDAVLTLAAGYALLTANNNDMLYIKGGASALTIPSGFVWAKSYSHLLGLAASTKHTGLARLNHSADFTPLFPITGSGCQFSNFRIQHGRGNAANLINVNLAGSNNSFYNVHMEGPNNATEAGAAFRQLVLASGAAGNTFVACSIGGREIQLSVTTGREIEFAGDNEDTYFEDCIIRSYADAAGHEQIEAGVDLGGESAMVEMVKCKFLQLDPNITLTKIIEPPTTGNILLSNCVGVRATNFSSGAAVLLDNSRLV
jgi:hypothetical protein